LPEFELLILFLRWEQAGEEMLHELQETDEQRYAGSSLSIVSADPGSWGQRLYLVRFC
jgi:hypothetical protein